MLEDLAKSLPDGISVERVMAAVARIGAAGRAAWPGVTVSDEAIAQRLAARLRDDPEAKLEELHDADLYLALVLAAGDDAALRAFEANRIPQIAIARTRVRRRGSPAD